MTEGASPITDEGEAPRFWRPHWDGVPCKFRPVLHVLITWADGRGSCDPTYDDIVAFLGCTHKTVQRAMVWLLKPANGGWVKRARAREPDGDRRLGGHRYWLHLEKLGLVARGRTTFAQPAERSGDANEARSPDNMSGQLPGHIVHPSVDRAKSPDNLSGQLGGQIVSPSVDTSGGGAEMSGELRPENKEKSSVPRERARAFLFSDFLSVSFQAGDGRREKAEAILAVCGPMLGDPAKQARVLESLAEVLNGPWDRFDLRDVLAAVEHRTRAAAKTKLWNFVLMTSNVEEWQAKRERAEAQTARAATSQAAKGVSGRSTRSGELDRMIGRGGVNDERALERRLAATRQVIALIEAGERPVFYLSRDEQRLDGEWLDDAFARLLAAKKAELLQLLAAERTERATGSEVGDGQG